MNTPSEYRSLVASLARPIALLAGLWLLFAGANAALLYIRPGADVVYAAKAQSIRDSPLFRREAAVKLVIFGNSKVLTAFRPDLFDSLSGDTVSSYNLGLPDYLLFIENLELLCQRGERPTHVLLMLPWPDTPERRFDIFKPGLVDSHIMDALFPFRKLPRNLLLFAVRSRSRGGVLAYYEESRRQAKAMLEQKGYYFIEGQSHYPGHRLPDDFRLQKDDPTQLFRRPVSVDAPAFHHLSALLERYDIRVILIPAYHREGEFAPAESRSAVADVLASQPRISVRGPDYWLLPNHLFSDPVHLNEDGAADYTRRTWELLGSELTRPGTTPAIDVAVPSDR